MSKLRLFGKRNWLAAITLGLALAIGWFGWSSFWQPAKGESLLYGKVADTRDWIDGVGTHEPGSLAKAKVTINSQPPQTTYTDSLGQFWFRDLRDVSYIVEVEAPYEKGGNYNFTTKVNGVTGKFFDLVQDEEHNLNEIDY